MNRVGIVLRPARKAYFVCPYLPGGKLEDGIWSWRRYALRDNFTPKVSLMVDLWLVGGTISFE